MRPASGPERHPTVQQAAAGNLRAESILQQVAPRHFPRSMRRFEHDIGPVPEFSAEKIVPRTQVNSAARLRCRYSHRSGGRSAPRHETVFVAVRAAAERAVSGSRGGGGVPGHHRPAARPRTDTSGPATTPGRISGYARSRWRAASSRLNALRAQLEVSGDEARVEDAPRGSPGAGSARRAHRRGGAGRRGRGAGVRHSCGVARGRSGDARGLRCGRGRPGAGCWTVPTSGC